MRTSSPQRLAAVVVAAWLITAAAQADDEGFVRISDDTAVTPANSSTCGPGGCVNGPGAGGPCGSACPQGACGPCGAGDCDDGRGCCLLGVKRCLHGRGPLPHEHCCPLTAMLCCNACTHSPDHGWNRPRHYPVHRVPVTYQYYWPAKWYGEPGSAFIGAYPMVYQPTDTTELGFYYQRVPYWTPRPSMLPPGPPWPPQWHHRDCSGPYDAGFGGGGMYGELGGGAGMGGPYVGGGVMTTAGREVDVERAAQ